ncbi:MAG: acyl--CoA ligase [Oscillospiraceae bacterium]|nr:acyl--CoA ligase [Oscillospiraceae bacterium]
MSSITKAFCSAFASGGSRTVVVSRSGSRVFRRSFAELQDDVQRMTAYYAAQGIRRGMRILAFAPPSYDLCVSMIAALQTGAPIMYVDIWAKQDSLRRVFADYRPDAVLVSGKTRFLRPFFREIGKIRHIIRTDRCHGTAPAAEPPPEPPEDTPALLTMTTGSTGRPKIAVRSHRDLMHQLTLIGQNLYAGCDETVLTTSYIYVFANILSGFTTVMPMLNLGRYSEKKLNRILSLFREEKVTMILTSPDFCLRADEDFPHLRQIYCGGAILNLHEACRIRRKFRRAACTLIYGSTECSIIASADLTEFIRTLKATGNAMLGRPVTGVRVRLTEQGEILVTSAALLAHYLTQDSGKETDSAGTLWHHTGDIAAEADGVLYYRGKAGRCVCIGDACIYNNEIEQAIIRCAPGIPKCAVLQEAGAVHVFLPGSVPGLSGIREVLRSFGISGAVLHRIPRIPCDVKHHTKIDYQKLKEYLT